MADRSDDPPDVSVPVTTQIHARFESADEPPDLSVPVPTIKFPTMGDKDFVLELRVPPDGMEEFETYKAEHDVIKIRVVPE